MAPSCLLDKNGKRVTLGREIGRGGEAAVYVVQEDPQTVAKVYHRELDAETAEKISCMVELQNERLLKLAAWPLGTLRNGKSSAPAGVLMRNVSGFKDVHLLYSPKSRVREFPAQANWRFLVHAAGNVARAFSVIHGQGHVIGDVNQSNVRVSPETAIVNLIDCDSFQISFQGRHYLCKVGSPLYTPPELQGKDFSGVLRTPNHDNFGLAILVFHLLFMGRHPFAGRFLGHGEMPIENAIGESRFAFAPDTQRTQMKPPPNCITLEDLSLEAGELFVKAFAATGPQNARPTGEQWAAALDSLEHQLQTCSTNRAHVFFRRLIRCPWCAIEGRTGVLLFLAYALAYGHAGFKVNACWDEISAVPGPGPDPSTDLKRVISNIKATRHAKVAGWKRKGLCAAAVLAGVAVVVACFAAGAASTGVIIATPCFAAVMWIFSNVERRTKAKLEAEARACDARLVAIEDRWQKEASERRFKNRLKDLSELVEEYNGLPMLRERRIRDLHRHSLILQLTRYLAAFDIASADIPHVKDGRKSMLSSYGIDTAADVNLQVLKTVPGFGDFLITQMMNWKQSLELKFRFDSKRGADPADLHRLDHELGKRRNEIESTLLQGRGDLEETRQQIILARVQLRDELEKAHIESAQAWANVEAA